MPTPSKSRDLSPVLPPNVNAMFPRRRCASTPDKFTHSDFGVSVQLSNITFTDPGVKPKPAGVGGTEYLIRDTALALVSPPAGTPTNAVTLQSLAKAIAQDFYDWRSQGFDIIYNGVCAVEPSGLLDIIEWRYDTEDQTTRVQSAPIGGEPQEFQHQDPAVSGCMTLDDRLPGILVDIPGGGVSSMSGVLAIEDGRLVLDFDSAIDLSDCSCGTSTPCGQACVNVVDSCTGLPLAGATVTLKRSGVTIATGTTSVSAITSVTLTAGGSGYATAPTVTISGGGGSGAAITATVANVAGVHKVVGLTITNGGSGYTSTPTVSFSGGGGSGATATVTLGLSYCVPYATAGSSNTYTVSKSGYASFTSGFFTLGCSGSPTIFSTTIRPNTAATICVHVIRCNGADDPGAMVTIKQGSTVKSAGAADGSGLYCWASAVDGTTYTVTVVPSAPTRYGTTPSPRVITGDVCAVRTLTYDLTTELGIATGYRCLQFCPDPLSDTLHLVSAKFGATTLTIPAPTVGGPAWRGQITGALIPGCFTCTGGGTLSLDLQLYDGVTPTLFYCVSEAGPPGSTCINPADPFLTGCCGFITLTSLTCKPLTIDYLATGGCATTLCGDDTIGIME